MSLRVLPSCMGDSLVDGEMGEDTWTVGRPSSSLSVIDFLIYPLIVLLQYTSLSQQMK